MRVRHHVNPLSILTEHRFDGFGDARDIVVDIGAYKGEFIARMREQFPQYNYIAMEVRARVAQRLRERFADAQNVAVFDGDGTRNFRAIVKPCQDAGAFIREVYINFPDPWPKARHKKRRIITETFLRATAQWLDARTTWVFQTDRADVFADTVAIVESLGYHYETFDAPPYGITTDWEDAKVAQGAHIHRMRFWVGVPARREASVSVTEKLSDRLIGAVAIVVLSLLYWGGRDDTH